MNTADDRSDFELCVDLEIHFTQIAQITQCVQKFSQAGEVSRRYSYISSRDWPCWRYLSSPVCVRGIPLEY